MADVMLHLEGETAEQVAAELGAVFESAFDPAGHGGIAPAPVLVEHERRGAVGASEMITMKFGIPNDLLAEDDLTQKQHLLERLRRVIEITRHHTEKSGLSARVDVGDLSQDLEVSEPDRILDAARRAG